MASPAVAQMSPEAVSEQIAEEFGVEVLRIARNSTMSGQTFLVTVMQPEGTSNAAFAVSRLRVDAWTGELVPAFRHETSGYQLPGADSFVPNRQGAASARDASLARSARFLGEAGGGPRRARSGRSRRACGDRQRSRRIARWRSPAVRELGLHGQPLGSGTGCRASFARRASRRGGTQSILRAGRRVWPDSGWDQTVAYGTSPMARSFGNSVVISTMSPVRG